MTLAMALRELTHVLADIAGLIGIKSFKDKQDEALRAFLSGQGTFHNLQQ